MRERKIFRKLTPVLLGLVFVYLIVVAYNYRAELAESYLVWSPWFSGGTVLVLFGYVCHKLMSQLRADSATNKRLRRWE